MNRIGQRSGIMVASLLAAAAVIAAEVQVPEIVVTPARGPAALTNVTQAVTVLQERDAETIVAPKANIAELLTWQPGTRVTVLSRNDANWGSFGGLGPKYSTFMLDGLPVDAFVDTQALDPWALDRVEVQRGPASVMYPNYLSQDFAGNQSPLSGTVNLIPRIAATAPRTRLDAAWGSYNTWRLRGAHENRIGRLGLAGGAFWEDSDYTNYGTENSWLNMLDDPEYSKLRLWAGGRLDLDEDGRHALSAFGNWMHHEGDAGRPNRGFDHEYLLVQGGYAGQLADQVSLTLRAGWRRYDRTWQEDNFFNGGDLSLASNNGVEQNIVPADVAIAFAHGEGSRLTLGADAQWADYQTWTDPGQRQIGNDSRSSQYGLFAQEEWLTGPWVLRGGARVAWTCLLYTS
ncbi:MAG: TonB-dependent receptor plug domain-containing protein, partial [Kiritimatiellae bacterium]|nr:TonB-dependent receptor plug domain-containing protein [Kiritimatiellia bacterium]